MLPGGTAASVSSMAAGTASIDAVHMCFVITAARDEVAWSAGQASPDLSIHWLWA